VAGRGVKALREAGVDVVTDVLKGEAMALNRIFITAHTRQRPYIILKWAQSSDGYIDRIRKEPAEKPVQLSIPVTRRYVHKLRSEVSAIMVGTNTARLDNPFLTVSHWSGNSPVRVFPDRTRRIPASYHLLDGSVRTLVVVQEVENGGNRGSGGSREILRSYDLMVLRSCTGSSENVEYIAIDFSAPVIPQLLHVLYSRRLYSLLVEGGAQMHKSFLDAGLWDEIHVETAPVMLGNGVKAPVCNLDEIATLQHTFRFSPKSVFGEDNSCISIYTSKNM
jgi:diaminohydroxyphosphoribosylaminopyrimidine deaminase/5-amino-6-(5-phosphoribosylamino)uracil reductase